jgi:hypothetical protein
LAEVKAVKSPQNSADVPSSFRDPSGFVFKKNGILYRQVNVFYKDNYDSLMGSGLYQNLVDAGLLIPHREVDAEPFEPSKAYKIIEPECIDFVSYPYEWCFSQLRDAALTTLRVQKIALGHGMSLKDCSTYNIQFQKGKPVFIDTLSFERYREGYPWIAYGQFCRHFLAPLALMAYKDIRLNQLLRVFIDGLPLDLASALLPLRTRFSFSLLSHIHLHARSQKHYASRSVDTSRYKMGRLSFLGLVDNLESSIKRMRWQPKGTEWADYYKDTNYSVNALDHKKEAVGEFLYRTNPKTVWDLGGNIGMFSRIASDRGIATICFDVDPAAIEMNYLQCVAKNEANILPLIIDLTNPSSGIGWSGRERMSLLERGPADTALALALVHHLAIANNVPIGRIAEFLHKLCRYLIIEFVPKSDSQVRRLLSNREDIFPDYTEQGFEREMGKYFKIESSIRIKESERILYLMQRNAA